MNPYFHCSTDKASPGKGNNRSGSFSVLLIGHANAGKSTLFSAISHSTAHSANYPGTTVQVKSATFHIGERTFTFYDLPGLASFHAISEDEKLAKVLLLESEPELIIQVIDAPNLARDLYLTVELLEFGYLPILVLNKADLAEASGIRLDCSALEKRLQTKVFKTVAVQPHTLRKLTEYLRSGNLQVHRRTQAERVNINYGRILQEYLLEIEGELRSVIASPVQRKFLAIELLRMGNDVTATRQAQGNIGIYGHRRYRRRKRFGGRHFNDKVTCHLEKCEQSPGTFGSVFAGNAQIQPSLLRRLERLAHEVKRRSYSEMGVAPMVLVAEARHNFVRGLLRSAISQPPVSQARRIKSLEEKLDSIFLNPFLGVLILFALMFGIFQLTFSVGGPLSDLTADGISWLGRAIGESLSGKRLLSSLIGDAIFGGVGTVLSFVPLIFILFFLLAILEDSGYLARAVLLLDSALRKFRLSGRSFIPMVISFGCNVPGILATRTIPNRRERLTSILAIPFMSCSARLPVYLILIAAFFERKWAGVILFSLYSLGILTALLFSSLASVFSAKKDVSLLVMELPKYQFPRLIPAIKGTWQQGKHYLAKAGSVIFAVSVLMWALFNLPVSSLRDNKEDFTTPKVVLSTPTQAGQTRNPAELTSVEARNAETASDSLAHRLGNALEPVFRPLGFDGKVIVGLIGAALAKEVFVSTMAVAINVEDKGNDILISEIGKRTNLTPLTALALMVFVLLYMPCLPSIIVMSRELKNAKLLAGALVSYFAVAYTLAGLVILIGRLNGIR